MQYAQSIWSNQFLVLLDPVLVTSSIINFLQTIFTDSILQHYFVLHTFMRKCLCITFCCNVNGGCGIYPGSIQMPLPFTQEVALVSNAIDIFPFRTVVGDWPLTRR